MATSQEKLKTLSALLPVLVAALIICISAKTAQCALIGQALQQECISSDYKELGECEDKLRVTLSVSSGDHDEIDVLQFKATGRDDELFPLIEGVLVTLEKTPPTATYALNYLHTVAYNPYEEVVRVQNTRPGTRACVDDPKALNPTCGWALDGNEKIPGSQGFCSNKDLLELIRGDAGAWWRGERQLGQQSTLEDSFSTAHCLRPGELYFDGYEINEPVLDYSIVITINNAGSVYTFSLSPRTRNYHSNEDPNYGGGNFGIFAELMGDMGPVQSPPQLGNYILYIPSTPETHPFVQDYQHNMLLVRREEVSIDGSDLNKVGVGFQAFRRQAAAAAASQAGDGLHNQLYHKHQADLQKLMRDNQAETDYLVHGKKMFKGAMNFEAGMEKALKYQVNGSHDTLVLLTMNAMSVKIVDTESRAVINSGYVDKYESMSKEGTLFVEVENVGRATADFVVTVTECNMNIVKDIPAQVQTINDGTTKTFQFDIHTLYSLNQNSKCKVTLKSDQAKVYDYVNVYFDTEKIEHRQSWELQEINDQSQTSP